MTNAKRKPTDAPIENDDTWERQHDWNLRQDTDSTVSTAVNAPTDQNDNSIQDEKFLCRGKYNLQSKSSPNLPDSYSN